jgi:serine-protein kinase ATM
MAQNLSAIIAGLQSESVKPRQDALARMDEALANDEVVDRLASSSGSVKRWLAVFQALFVAVAVEKTSCVKKGFHKATSVSISRLEKAGSVVRNATERNVVLLPYKVVQSLLEHLMNAMIDKARNRLLAPVSLNYIKSIVVICSHSPHLDHLDPELWNALVSLAFAVILETSLAPPRGFTENDLDQTSDQSGMGLDDPHNDISELDDDAPTGSKRARRRSPSCNQQQPSGSKSPIEITRTMSQEQIEFMGLLVILFRSPHAPFLRPGIARHILDRIHRFFVAFPTWSIAHTNAVVSINVVLSQLELNMTKTCTDFALKMWPLLLSYWNGREKKDKVVREELVVTMITFFPLVTVPEVSQIPTNWVQERVAELYQCLQDDIDRFIFESLPLDSLRLHLHAANDVKDVFDAITFRSGYKFDPPNALSWAILELHADCAGAVCLLHDGPHTQHLLNTLCSCISIRKELMVERNPNDGDENLHCRIF